MVNARVLSPVSMTQPLISAARGPPLYTSIHSSLELVKLSAFQSTFRAFGKISLSEIRTGKGVAVVKGVAVGFGVGELVGVTLGNGVGAETDDGRETELDALDATLEDELGAELDTLAGISGCNGPSFMVKLGRLEDGISPPPPLVGHGIRRPRASIHVWAFAGVTVANTSPIAMTRDGMIDRETICHVRIFNLPFQICAIRLNI